MKMVSWDKVLKLKIKITSAYDYVKFVTYDSAILDKLCIGDIICLDCFN